MTIKDIQLDFEDRDLFSYDDLQLKADAIKFSILPKMEVIINHAIYVIDRVFDTSVYRDSTIGKSPQHKATSNRKNSLKDDFDFARAVIGSKRSKDMWKGLRYESKSGQPYYQASELGLRLDANGISTNLKYFPSKNYSRKTNRKFFSFYKKYHEEIMYLSSLANMHYLYDYEIGVTKDLNAKFTSNYPYITFSSFSIKYPLEYADLANCVDSLVIMYPIYKSLTQVAKGEEETLQKDMKYLNSYFDEDDSDGGMHSTVNQMSQHQIGKRIDSKIKVQTGIRWQCFKRDNWRCVSCGKSAHDNVILHVDHIIPRSKGGSDSLGNYQTLCFQCNIGKSNKDDTDLRYEAN